MKQNVGSTDKIIRIVLAIGFFWLFFLLSGPMMWLGLIGIVPLATALFGTCPIYTLLGMNTCPVKKS
ncbi:MAG TPA: DUF2892 domain-containing protein [Fimbriimonas sp.]|nr:DUF2892 domain-containing protein [Fimbriimonas sp.]